MIAFDDVRVVDDLTDADARRAGWASRDAVFKQFARRTGDLYRIELHYAGRDPRAVLRETPPTPELHRRIERMGRGRASSTCGLIADEPRRPAPDLAAGLGMETRPFKMRVRRLKELGLTESLPIGYRLFAPRRGVP